MTEIIGHGFRVAWNSDGYPIVERRDLIGRRGSWTISKLHDGTIVKENGCSWSESVLGAIEREAESIMLRFSLPKTFSPDKEYRKMCLLIREAVDWGKLIGQVFDS